MVILKNILVTPFFFLHGATFGLITLKYSDNEAENPFKDIRIDYTDSLMLDVR